MRKSFTKIFWNIEVWAVQKHVNLVDLVKSFPTNSFLQNLASIQRRTSPLKFAHLAEKSEKGSISNLSTKPPTVSRSEKRSCGFWSGWSGTRTSALRSENHGSDVHLRGEGHLVSLPTSLRLRKYIFRNNACSINFVLQRRTVFQMKEIFQIENRCFVKKLSVGKKKSTTVF